MDFVVTHDFKAPYVMSTGIPSRPTEIKTAFFKKGAIIKGDIKKGEDNLPSFVLHKGVMPIPLDVLKKIEVKSLTATDVSKVEDTKSFDGTGNVSKNKPKIISKVDYVDGVFVGSIFGIIGAILAEKNGFVNETNNTNKMIGVGIGIGISLYVVYKLKNK
jgi:hypothetical protein